MLVQVFYMSLFVFVFALVGAFYPYNRGALYTAIITLYALTACIAGYVASSYYKQMEGEFWVRNILMTCFIYCGPFLGMFSFLNTVAIAYRVSSSAGVGGRWGLGARAPSWERVEGVRKGGQGCRRDGVGCCLGRVSRSQ